MSNKLQCTVCKNSFSSLTNLRRHAKNIHKDLSLVPMKYKEKQNFLYTCACGKNFNHKRHFQSHVKVHEKNEPNNRYSHFRSKQCPLCDFSDVQKENMLSHFTNVHEINISTRELYFDNVHDFEEWKNNIKDVAFVTAYTKMLGSCKLKEYKCSRSGLYIPKKTESERIRCLKRQGSNKINSFCPVSITLKEGIDGRCHISYVETHVGHKNEIGNLFLKPHEKHEIARKISAKIPFDNILNDIRDSITESKLERIHLLTKKDLYNIEHSFNLNSDAVRHSGDALSVDAWVSAMQEETVLFYKPQEQVCEEHPELRAQDFLLIIMTPAQCGLLKNFASNCICIDRTHGLNSCNFELVTLMTIDDMHQGFPCAFFFTNRTDKATLEIFFTYIRKMTGTISPQVFMSDIAESFYNSWLDVMDPAEHRLYCSWHLDRAWRKNLLKITGRDKQAEIYKFLRTLVEERDVSAFTILLQGFCKEIMDDAETANFGKYFMDNFCSNYSSWADCYRLHAGINTNMHIERMHRTIKYIYLHETNVNRLNKAIDDLMSFIRDKMFDRLLLLNNGQLTGKLQKLRTRHKKSLNLDLKLINQTENGWELPSSTSENHEIYSTEAPKDCSCKLGCTFCNTSMNVILEDEKNPLYIIIDHASEETEAHLNRHITTVNYVNDEKEKLYSKFMKHFNNIKSVEEVEVFKKCLAPLSPNLAAVKVTDSNEF